MGQAGATKVEMRRALCGSDDLDSFLRFVDHRVERGNHLANVLKRTDLENYVNRDVKFAFEYELPFKKGEGPDVPNDVPMILAVNEIVQAQGEMRNLATEDVAGESFVFSYWGGKPMPVLRSELVNSVEKLVPSRFAVRSESKDSAVECVRNAVGQSVLHGFIKTCGSFTEGELDGLLVARPGCEGRDDFPISVIESSSKPLNDAIGDVGDFTYDGFVAFSVGGALAGLLVRFEDVSEGALFAEQFGKLSDVFRGPVNLN